MVGLDRLSLDTFLLGKDAEEAEAHRDEVLRIARSQRLAATPRTKRFSLPPPRRTRT